MANDNYKSRLLNIIPGGAHVHSKSYDQFPENAPSLTERSSGCYLYDRAGKKYLDYGMALRSVTIGYSEPEINSAVIDAIQTGNTSTLPTYLELLAAELLADLIDSVDMVKFTKDGSTATSAAVKLARAYTGRKRVLACADQPFFSYDDWFIGTTSGNRGGLPEDYQYTHRFSYNDISQLEQIFDQYPNEIACVILEPALSILEPENDFLSKLRTLCDEKGTVLIFDEMITGFRWHLQGGQHYYGVKPDLCTFGKGMGNGFSVSALGGRKDIMGLGRVDLGEERVFYLSATHGAEMTGLAAFIATVKYYRENNVIDHLWDYGNQLIRLINDIADGYGFSRRFSAGGLGCLPYYKASNEQGEWDAVLTRSFQKEMMNNGVIVRNIAICYRHDEQALTWTAEALEKTFSALQKSH